MEGKSGDDGGEVRRVIPEATCRFVYRGTYVGADYETVEWSQVSDPNSYDPLHSPLGQRVDLAQQRALAAPAVMPAIVSAPLWFRYVEGAMRKVDGWRAETVDDGSAAHEPETSPYPGCPLAPPLTDELLQRSNEALFAEMLEQSAKLANLQADYATFAGLAADAAAAKDARIAELEGEVARLRTPTAATVSHETPAFPAAALRHSV